MPFEPRSDVRSNVRKVLDSIGEAVFQAGRAEGSVRLVAVSKTVQPDAIREAIAAGATELGENRVQEALAKKPQLIDQSFRLHLIGPLQKNKANRAVEIFDWIETLDDLDLAARLNRFCERLDKQMPVLVQVNVGEEPTKSGILESQALEFVHQAAAFQHMSIRGLMTIPPYFENPEQVRPYFARLRRLGERIAEHHLENVSMLELSMGMSHDFVVAIEEGATLVRIGTAIFGARVY
jgi:PLP dependent protein